MTLDNELSETGKPPKEHTAFVPRWVSDKQNTKRAGAGDACCRAALALPSLPNHESTLELQGGLLGLASDGYVQASTLVQIQLGSVN